MTKREKLRGHMDELKKHSSEAKKGRSAHAEESLMKKHRDLVEKTDLLDKHVRFLHPIFIVTNRCSHLYNSQYACTDLEFTCTDLEFTCTDLEFTCTDLEFT